MVHGVLLWWLGAASRPSLDGNPSRVGSSESNAEQRERELVLWGKEGRHPEIRIWPMPFTAPVLVEVAGSSLA